MRKILLISWMIIFSLILMTCNAGTQSRSMIISATAPHQKTVTSLPTEATKTTSPTLSPTATWVPVPIMPSAEAHQYALKMFKTNGNCLFPCWIGITPGVTTWKEVYTHLAPFADFISTPFDLEDHGHEVKFTFSDTSYRGIATLGGVIYVKGGIVEAIDAVQEMPLSDLLSTFGTPTEIRLFAEDYSTVDILGRFKLVLFYQNKGIMAIYDGNNDKGKIIRICPGYAQGTKTRWLLWPPEQKLTFLETGSKTMLISSVPPPGEEDFIPLEKLSGIDNETFTNRYKDPKNQDVCIEMQAPDWSPDLVMPPNK